MFSPQQEVVLDGELSLNLNIDGEMSLDLHMDGEAGTVIKVVERDAPTYQGQTTVAVYGRSRSGNYIFVPQLTIVQTA